MQILLRLKDADLRFSDLRAALPSISANVLTQRMRGLESAGLVRRAYLPPPAASHVYGLAALAEALRPILDDLASWRAQHQPTHLTYKADISGIVGRDIVPGENQAGESD